MTELGEKWVVREFATQAQEPRQKYVHACASGLSAASEDGRSGAALRMVHARRSERVRE